MVTLAGQAMVGGVLSLTTMICAQVLVLPQSSVANHVRVIVPLCGHAPPAFESVKVTVGEPSQLSVAVAEPVTTGNVLTVHSNVMFAGQVSTGATLSSTTIVCAQVLELPQASVALQVRVIVLS